MDNISDAKIKLVVDGKEKAFRKTDGMVGRLKPEQKCVVQIELGPEWNPINHWVFRKSWINSSQVIQPLENIAEKRRRPGPVYEFKVTIKDVHPDNKGNIVGPVTRTQENNISFLAANPKFFSSFTLYQITLASQAGNFFVRTQEMMSSPCYNDKKTGRLFCPDIPESDPGQSVLLDFLDKKVFAGSSVLETRNYFQTRHNKSLKIEPGMGVVKFFNPATGIGCAACNLDDKTCEEDLVDVRLVWDRMPVDPSETHVNPPHFQGLCNGDVIRIPKFASPDLNHRGIIYRPTSFAIEAYGQYEFVNPEKKDLLPLAASS